MTMAGFADKNVLVTAGAAGIGEAIARAFAAAGASVHAVDVDAAAVARLNASQPGIDTSVADVAVEDEVERVFARYHTNVDGVADGLAVLVNCAGIAGPTALLEDIAPADWRRCVAVNLDATFLCCRQAIPLMRAARSGVIINISSTAGWHGYALRAPYVAAKWGVIGLTKTLAMELGPAGIRANAICPGSIDGARMDRVIADEAANKQLSEDAVRQRYTAGVSLRTFIDARDIADAALFLASDAASKITGQALNVDGHLENTGSLDQ